MKIRHKQTGEVMEVDGGDGIDTLFWRRDKDSITYFSMGRWELVPEWRNVTVHIADDGRALSIERRAFLTWLTIATCDKGYRFRLVERYEFLDEHEFRSPWALGETCEITNGRFRKVPVLIVEKREAPNKED